MLFIDTEKDNRNIAKKEFSVDLDRHYVLLLKTLFTVRALEGFLNLQSFTLRSSSIWFYSMEIKDI